MSNRLLYKASHPVTEHVQVPWRVAAGVGVVEEAFR